MAHYEGHGMPVIESLACGTNVMVGDEWELNEPVIKAKKYDTNSIYKSFSKFLKNVEKYKNIDPSVFVDMVKDRFGWNKLALDIVHTILFDPKRGHECDYIQNQKSLIFQK
jgi:hypothetical protein